MHSIASGDPVQTCESDSRSTANSPTTRPSEKVELSVPLGPGSSAIGQAVAPLAINCRLAWLSQCVRSVFKCSLPQTHRILASWASIGCQDKTFTRSSQKFSITRNHPEWRLVSMPHTAQDKSCAQSRSIAFLSKYQQLTKPTRVSQRSSTSWLSGTVIIPCSVSNRSVKWEE